MSSPPYTIKPRPNFLSVRQLECFSDDMSHTRRRLPVMIDYSRLRFIRPLAVVATVLFMEEMLSRGRAVELRWPSNSGTVQYLLHIGLPKIIDSLGHANWPQDTVPSLPPGLRPMITLTKFTNSQEIEDISERMAVAFDEATEVPANLRSPCHQVFSELADNVLAHSGSAGYVLAQRFEYQTGPVIDIAIGDCGIGIKQSLWKKPELRPKLTSDAAALRLAMEDGITTTTDRYRGFGLGYVGKELSTLNRSLVLRSGTAAISWKEGKPEIPTYNAGKFMGTLAHAIIPC